jgi:putative redox protein
LRDKVNKATIIRFQNDCTGLFNFDKNYFNMSSDKVNRVNASISTVPYTTRIRAGNHEFYTDEPESEGGAGKGPKCHDLLLASLASCTCITLKMYAQTKGWLLNGVDIDAEMNRQVINGVQVTEVNLKLRINGDVDDDQRKRMLFIAGKCPVHKTLAPSMKISISLML